MPPRVINLAAGGRGPAGPWSPVIAGEVNGDQATDKTKTMLERV